MSYLVVRDSAGKCRGCGPNDGNFQPAVPPGGSTEISAVWVPIEPTSEEQRLAGIDSAIAGFSFGGKTLAELQAMDNAAFDAWWSANITNLAQASAVLKLLSRTMLRRVL